MTGLTSAPSPDVMDVDARRDAAQSAAWAAFCAATLRAQETLDQADGLMAGKAWGRFLRLFEPSEPLDAVGGGMRFDRASVILLGQSDGTAL